MPLVLAHRGASHHYPPNTIEAFRAAATLGADGVELDVRLTADGVAVVHHDPAWPSGGVIRHTTYAELPVWIPSLDAVLAACAGLALVNIEIKNGLGEPDHDPAAASADAVVALVRDRARSDTTLATRVVVSSFDAASLRRVRELAPELATALLVIEPDDAAFAAVADDGHRGLNPWYGFVDEALVARAADAGVDLHPWTVDGADDLARLGGLGVASIITNRPDRARLAVGAA